MSTVTFPVRETVKTIFQDELVQPFAPEGDLDIWILPEDEQAEENNEIPDSYPAILIQKAVYEVEDSWRRITQVDLDYVWTLEIVVLLAQSRLPDSDAQKLVEEWQTAVMNVIASNPTMRNAIEQIVQEDDGTFVRSRDGYYDKYVQQTTNPDSHWGIGFRMRVVQRYEYAEMLSEL